MPQVEACKPGSLAVVVVGAAIACLGLGFAAHSAAQTKTQPPNASPAPAAEEGVRWRDLGPAQRLALRPLENDWGSISANQKQKWLEIANRFPGFQPEEKTRVQARMSEWARLSAEQRTAARMNFQRAKEVAPRDRQAEWKAYQSLPADERRRLAARAEAVPGADAAKGPAGRPRADDSFGAGGQQNKSNIVPNPAFAAQPRAVAPTVLQAQPGATTSSISRRATPPPHQQTGLPKIAASPNFVDKATLLPQRGPQGAAARPAGASAAEANPRR